MKGGLSPLLLLTAAVSLSVPAEPLVILPLCLPASGFEEDAALCLSEEVMDSGLSIERLSSRNFIISGLEMVKLTSIANSYRTLEIKESSGRVRVEEDGSSGIFLQYDNLSVSYDDKSATASGRIFLSLDLSTEAFAVMTARVKDLELSGISIADDTYTLTVELDDGTLPYLDNNKIENYYNNIINVLDKYNSGSDIEGKAERLARFLAYASEEPAKALGLVSLTLGWDGKTISLRPLLDKASAFIPVVRLFTTRA